MSFSAHVFILLIASAVQGCSSTSLSGRGTTLPSSANATNGAETSKRSGNTIDFGNIGEPMSGNSSEGGADPIINIETPFPVKNGSVDVVFEAGFPIKSRDVKTLRPLTVYFALDATASMNSVISSVKNGIRAFVAKLIEKKFDVKIGLVTFNDAVDPVLGATDVDTFLQKISEVNAAGGDDPNEAALKAFTQALDSAIARAPQDAVKAILLITDEPGHTGEAQPRNCQINSVVDALKSKPLEQQELVKIFYSVEQKKRTSCGGYDSAREQWDDILTSVLPSVPAKKRGAALPYPFDGNVLVNDFVNLLEKATPGEDLVCLVNKGELLQDGSPIEHFSNDNLSELYQKYVDKSPYVWTEALPKDRVSAAIENGKNTAKLSACCIRKAAAMTGDFSQCEEQKSVTVNFRILAK
jgi:hypothetical protein